MNIDEIMNCEIEKFIKEAPAQEIRNSDNMTSFLDSFQNLIFKYWEKHPTYRFGQILTIFQTKMMTKGTRDFFYIEDSDFLKKLEEFVDE